MTAPLAEVVATFLTHYQLRAEGFVLAVSGGADSVALLRACTSLNLPLAVAHLNHQLRGADSDADEAFVRALADQLAVPCHCAQINVADHAQGDNLEQTARTLRYDWLATVARNQGWRFVVTAHTADDQAETVLHHLLRGTGLQGLRGIAARRALTPAVEVLRPLLAVRRAAILAYLAELGQAFQVDLSNHDTRFTRNRIRHELLPVLERDYNPATSTLLCRLAEQAEEAYRDVRTAAEQLLCTAERPRSARQRVFDLACLRAVSPFRVRELFRLVWEREGWSVSAMSFARWKALEAVVFGAGVAVDMPGRIRVRRRGQVLLVGPIGEVEGRTLQGV